MSEEQASEYAMDRVFNKTDGRTASEVAAERDPTMTAQWFSYRRHVLDLMANDAPYTAAQRKAYIENARTDWFGGAMSICVLIQEQKPELMRDPFMIGLYQEVLSELYRSPDATKLTDPLPGAKP